MKIIIIGQGGHSKVITDIVYSQDNMEVIGYLDDKHEELRMEENLYIGPVEAVGKLISFIPEARIVVGIGNNRVRKTIVSKLNLPETYYISLVHERAVVSPSAHIGHGTVIMATAVVNADSIIGNHTIINTGAVVEHDNKVGDYVHISPNATLTGSIDIEEGVHVGANATIIPNLTIKEWSVIGAGATVIHHIPSYCTAVGIPAKVKMREGDMFENAK